MAADADAPAATSSRWSMLPVTRIAALIAALSLALVACTPGSPTGSAAEATPTAIASESPGESQVPPSVDESVEPAPSDEPTDGLGPFACSAVSSPGPTARAQITDVRVGTHTGFDRVVIEFVGGIPQYIVEPATPPFFQDASGLPLTVNGDAFWHVVLNGGTKVSPEGGITYSGETEFSPGYPQLVHVIEGGDFEAVSNWYIGTNETACARVLTLSAPDRLVIDLEHRP